ncbi:MAG: chemotaxis protein CheA [Planctomycetes bacterium]|nr:chemotaxis protein CheA [Planctomycetota bacterium]
MENADLIADYLGEANDYLERLSTELLSLENEGLTEARVNELFRAAHSLKGLSACFGFERTNALTHRLESLLARMQRGEIVPDAPVIRLMFDAVDLLAELTAEVGAVGREGAEIELVGARLDAIGSTASPTDLVARAAVEVNEMRAAAPTSKPRSEETETVRVKMERLDRLINMTGELVIARSRFQLATRAMQSLPRSRDLELIAAELVAGLEGLVGEADARAGSLLQRARRLQTGLHALDATQRVSKDLEDATYDLEGIVSGIHGAVLEVRLVPLESLFRRLQRVVRDTCEAVDKQVDVEFVGGDTQLDKRVADELMNPLVHLVRNAIDHGLERGDVREAAGKGKAGRLSISGVQRGNSVVIEVADDGGGIDPARVTKKALETGLLTAEQAAALSPEEAQRLIFKPGFSTAGRVTEVSGRGMGMDIVESTIKKLRGNLDLTSTVGQGSVFQIQLPPSVSILACLLVRARATTFAVPLAEVQEIVPLPQEGATVQGRRVVLVRRQPIPVVAMDELFRFPALTPAEARANHATHAVIVQTGRQPVAVSVEALVGKEDLVIKPLCAELQDVRGLAGMAVRGDGAVTLILDGGAIAELAAQPSTGLRR